MPTSTNNALALAVGLDHRTSRKAQLSPLACKGPFSAHSIAIQCKHEQLHNTSTLESYLAPKNECIAQPKSGHAQNHTHLALIAPSNTVTAQQVGHICKSSTIAVKHKD